MTTETTSPGRTAGNPRTSQQALDAVSRVSTGVFIDGEWTVPEAAEDTIVATRQFARRQLTWFRADPRIHWLDWQDPALLATAVGLCRF